MRSLPSGGTLLVLTVTAALSATAWGQSPVDSTLPRVVFDSLPAGWVSQENVMDDIWKPLRARGVNYYAYGGPARSRSYAARSDPASPLYQAWLGAYVVVGALDSASADSAEAQQRWMVALAERDQRSWLEAMGDSSPLARTVLPMRRSAMKVAGATRALYQGEMRSHSDLSESEAPLAKALGMPPASLWRGELPPFHDLLLHVQAAIWYDRTRRLTVLVYGASAAYRSRDGVLHDNGPRLDPLLRAAMARARLLAP